MSGPGDSNFPRFRPFQLFFYCMFMVLLRREIVCARILSIIFFSDISLSDDDDMMITLLPYTCT